MADNQKMWGELGMNLEMHDMLCEVLPGAIGDVYVTGEQTGEDGFLRYGTCRCSRNQTGRAR